MCLCKDEVIVFDLIIERLCLADAGFRPPPSDQLTYPERVSLLVLIIHIHAWRIIRDRRREEEARGMSRRRFFSRTGSHRLSHSVISLTLMSEDFTMDLDTRMFKFSTVLKVIQILFVLWRFSMKPTRIRMCHSLVMNYGLYKRMEIFVSKI